MEITGYFIIGTTGVITSLFFLYILSKIFHFQIPFLNFLFSSLKGLKSLGEKRRKIVVSMVVLDFPDYNNPERKVLVIKRPPYDKWEPGKYSPPCGHIEDEDIEKLKKVYGYSLKDPTGLHHLLILTATRELREEIGGEPRQVHFEYVGVYYDRKTGYHVYVLRGYALPPEIERLEEVYKKGRLPKVKPTEEAKEVKWIKVKDLIKLKEEGKLAGSKSFEMALLELFYTKKD